VSRTRALIIVPTACLAIVVAIGCGPSSGALGTLPPVSADPSIDTGPDATAGSTTPPASPSDAPSGSPSTGPTGTPNPTPATDTMVVRAYFVLGGEPGTTGLVAVLREVPKSEATARASIEALLAGPTAAESGERAVTSAVPAGSRLLGLTIRNGLATIDLSSEFESGGGSASTLYRLGQVVYTLTQFSTVRSVVFQVDGTTVKVFGSEGVVLDGPVGRAEYVDLLPAIFVDRPAYGAAIGNPARVAGSANVFEATFRITILDGAGKTLVDQQAMASCGTGCRGTFDVTLRYDVAKAQWGTLRVWDGSAKDGSPENVREYPVWLTPAG
jgi:germination protein M